MKPMIALGVFCALLFQPSALMAQPLGTFRWQLQPYCNTLTVTVFQEGSTFRLQGHEYLCDTIFDPQPVYGIAVPAGDGVVIALTTGTSGGFSFKSTRVTARISLPSLTGGWADDAGRRGDFVPVTDIITGGTTRGSEPLAFVHIVTAANRRPGGGDNVTCFSHPLTDANPGAVISVTPNRGNTNALRPLVSSTVSLYMHLGATDLAGNLSENVWCISRNDSQQMPLGAGFTVHVLSP